jgi:glycosyltransferase involved in cell wall biosynthesis
MSNLTIGVAIPCYINHITILRDLLNSIEQQTRKPDKVVVSCSSSQTTDIPSSYFEYSFPIIIYTISQVLNAAQNRNIAISQLNTDIVTFIDADDQMHPQRLEIIEQCFLTQDVKILGTSFETDDNREFDKYTEFPFEINKLYVCPARSVQHINYITGNIIHNGQYSVSRDVLQHIKFREEPEFFGREDTFFGGDVILTYPGQNAYCPLRLSRYKPSRTQIPDNI